MRQLVVNAERKIDMFYFFDHRGFDKSFVTVTIDNHVIGCAFLQKNRITRIELPQMQNIIQLSFSTKRNYDIEEIQCEEIDEETFKDRKYGAIPKYKYKIDDEWLFPYDCIIDTKEGNEDCIFSPTECTQEPLVGGIYYAGFTLKDSAFVEITLQKNDISRNSEQARKKNLIKYSLACIVLSMTLAYAIYQLVFNDLSSYYARGMCFIGIASFLVGWSCFSSLSENVRGTNTWRDKLLKDVYHVTEEGLLISVDEG